MRLDGSKVELRKDTRQKLEWSEKWKARRNGGMSGRQESGIEGAEEEEGQITEEE